MFPPDADQTPFTSVGASPGLRAVNHNNTRLPSQTETDDHSNESEPPTPSRSLIGAAIAGTPCESPRHRAYSVTDAM